MDVYRLPDGRVFVRADAGASTPFAEVRPESDGYAQHARYAIQVQDLPDARRDESRRHPDRTGSGLVPLTLGLLGGGWLFAALTDMTFAEGTVMGLMSAGVVACLRELERSARKR